MAAWMAVPCATASSGDTSQLGYLPPKYSRSILRTYAMRVEPPTSTTSSTSSRRMPTVESTLATGKRALRTPAAEEDGRGAAQAGRELHLDGEAAALVGGVEVAAAVALVVELELQPLSSSRSARIASASSSRAYDGSFAFTR
eukprot:CAMPEP_0195598092 /NCGR_PEP_ID=MMETSP0815-20121206/3330_1 /TAXON_ID=97485 /ORGANISM="Prymnesium parvum, Strain Texoma1" /LENGTH=142 /DNA_ID=CAMNT_0040737469 /DNA_START=276 /DNA_END=703 /DNA_ORIENTATION=-